jgi:Helix-turn-helix domain
VSPAQLARLLDCSQRTAREYCKSGLIPEAFRTRGGHWRIRMPLSVKTRYELEKRQADWPFKGMKGDFGGDWNPDLAEWLLLAQLFEADIRDAVPVLYLAELADHQEELTEHRVGGTGKESNARQIQDLINQRLKTGEPFSDLLLIGWVYQFWRKNDREPTVVEISKLMGISRDTFYRRHSPQELHRAYLIAAGEFKRDLPDPDGLDPVQRANRTAKKATFKSLQRDYKD